MKGLLLINLGSPDSTSISDVKKYLDEFLMDKRVIGKSYIFANGVGNWYPNTGESWSFGPKNDGEVLWYYYSDSSD